MIGPSLACANVLYETVEYLIMRERTTNLLCGSLPSYRISVVDVERN